MFFDLTASLIRSTSCWYLLRSREAFSLASFSADSKALTLSAVALNRFSSFGSSHRRSALSRTSWGKNTYQLYCQKRKSHSSMFISKKRQVTLDTKFYKDMNFLPVYELLWAVQDYSPEKKSFAFEQHCLQCHLSQSLHSMGKKVTSNFSSTKQEMK